MKDKTSYCLFRLQTDTQIELGVEVKNTIEEILKFVEPEHSYFFKDTQKQFNCNFSLEGYNTEYILFSVKNLNNKFYTDVLFALNNKLETMFVTSRLYMKVLT
jgi:hypothetical protein